MTFTTAALIVSWLAIAVLALGLAGLLRQVAELRGQVRLVGAGVRGGAGPATGAASLIGLALPSTGPLSLLRPDGGGVIVITSPGCSSCHQAVAALSEAGLAPHTVAVSASTCEFSGLQRCVGQAVEAVDLLAVPATPYLIAVDADGVMRGTVVPGDPDEVTDFAHQMLKLIRPPRRLDLTPKESGT